MNNVYCPCQIIWNGIKNVFIWLKKCDQSWGMRSHGLSGRLHRAGVWSRGCSMNLRHATLLRLPSNGRWRREVADRAICHGCCTCLSTPYTRDDSRVSSEIVRVLWVQGEAKKQNSSWAMSQDLGAANPPSETMWYYVDVKEALEWSRTVRQREETADHNCSQTFTKWFLFWWQGSLKQWRSF